MAGKRIQDLNTYGAVDKTKAKKDLVELSKNEGNYDTPAYGVVLESVKIPLEGLADLLGAGKPFYSATHVIDVVFTGASSNPYGLFAPFSVTSDDDCKRFVFNVSGVGYVHYGNNAGVLINLPVTPRDGFVFVAHFNTIGANRNSANNFYQSSGRTYIYTYRALTDNWYIDEWVSIDSAQVTYLASYGGNGADLYLTNTNHNYIFDGGYTGNSAGYQVRKYKLIDSNLCVDRYVDFFFVTDWETGSGSLKIYAEDATGIENTIIGYGTSWTLPSIAKAGSHIRFKALKNHKWAIDKQNILI